MTDQYQNYGCYADLAKNGRTTIYTAEINSNNIKYHFNWVINILNDGIETDWVQNMFITVVFTDGVDVDLTIFDYAFNLSFWVLTANNGDPIDSLKLVFFENVTTGNIASYINQVFLKKNRTKIPFRLLNNYIDDVFSTFRSYSNYQLYLSNTLCLKDTIDLMNQYSEFNDTMHLDLSNVPLEDVNDVSMKNARVQIKYIENSGHCMRDSFRTGQGTSPKQHREVFSAVGTKPNGLGSVYPYVIGNSFVNGGLDNPIFATIDSSVGRIAQILQKTNVGTSGAFARLLGLNNIDTKLHDDPIYSCDTKNFEIVTIKNKTILKMYDMRYYRTNPRGLDFLLDADTDSHLIGQTLYFRSPMTCASYSRGQGICYRCYGDLAYVNNNINSGKIAAELLSSIYTQKLLSAKHLLESAIVAMKWTNEFYKLFSINFNTIQLMENQNYSGYTLIINADDIFIEDEEDELDYNEYITSFDIRTPTGDIVSMHTMDTDNIYIHSDLSDILASYNTDTIEIDLSTLVKIPILFVMEVKNNELSRTMDQVKKIINCKDVTKQYDRNSILEAFIDTNIEGGIILNAVHFEVLLANQLRDAEDILEKPEWQYENEASRMLTLNDALTNNPSITVRLQYSKISKTLITPSSFRITKPSNLDLYHMEKPQEFINNKEVVSNEKNKLINDIETDLKPAIIFEEGYGEE